MGVTISRDPSLTTNNNNIHYAKKLKTVKQNKEQEKRLTSRTIYGREYHAIENSTYMLPKDDKEVDRLHDQHFIIKEILGFNIMKEAFHLLDFQKSNLNILDVCCGPATWLCEESLEYPSCQFTGIDMCSLWPQVIRPANLHFTEANILQGLPYPDNSFDFVHMRFVVLAFKSKEWPFILSEIKRVLKDGGCFQCVEVDMRINITTIDNVAKTYMEAFESFCESYQLDPSVAAKYDTMLVDNGMKIVQSDYREVPLGWGGPVGHAYLHTFQGILEGLAPWLKKSLNIEQDENYHILLDTTKRALVRSRAFIGLYAFLAQK